MKITCIQMDMAFARPAENFDKAERLVRDAMADSPDVVVLPETFSTGFFPRENLMSLCDQNGEDTKRRFCSLARELGVNLVAGSVANARDGKIYNTAFVFDRAGAVVAEYDKTHLFSHMGEHEFFERGDHLSHFTLDGVPCGILICYDLRFPELARSLALREMNLLFAVSQWPAARTYHLRTLCAARAIENQTFLALCNSCGTAGETVYGGSSAILDPWGTVLAEAGAGETRITADCDMGVISGIRNSINVFADRRAGLYEL